MTETYISTMKVALVAERNRLNNAIDAIDKLVSIPTKDALVEVVKTNALGLLDDALVDSFLGNPEPVGLTPVIEIIPA